MTATGLVMDLIGRNLLFKKNPQILGEDKYILELDETPWQSEMKQSKTFRLKI